MKLWMFCCFALAAVPAMAQQPTQQQAGAIRSACRGDYPNVCAGVPTGGQAALSCLQQHAGTVSSGCQQALAALGAPASGQPTAAQAAPPPAHAADPRAEMQLLRTSCRYDFRRFCRGTQPGGGRILACLKANGPSLSPACQSAMLSLRGAR